MARYRASSVAAQESPRAGALWAEAEVSTDGGSLRHAMPTTRINTKRAPRRELAFSCADCLRAELDRIGAAHARGTLRTSGNWTPGENLQHCAKLFECAMDGWPTTAPWVVRVLGTLIFKKRLTSGRTPPAGIPLGKDTAFLLPEPGCSFDKGMAAMREVLARLDGGKLMQVPSPVFGKLSHDEWMRCCLGHAQLHLGFLWLE